MIAKCLLVSCLVLGNDAHQLRLLLDIFRHILLQRGREIVSAQYCLRSATFEYPAGSDYMASTRATVGKGHCHAFTPHRVAMLSKTKNDMSTFSMKRKRQSALAPKSSRLHLPCTHQAQMRLPCQ